MPDQERGRRPQDLPGGDEVEELTDGLKIRTVRVSDGLWDAASELAAAEGSNVSVVIRGLLTQYVRRERRRS